MFQLCMDKQPVVLRQHASDPTRLFAGTIDGHLLAINIADVIDMQSADPDAEMVVDAMSKDVTIVDPIAFCHEGSSCRALDNLDTHRNSHS